MNDSDPQSDAVRLIVLQKMSPSRRFAMAAGWSNSLRELIRSGLKQQFSEESEEFRRRLLADRWLGVELASKVYGREDSHG